MIVLHEGDKGFCTKCTYYVWTIGDAKVSFDFKVIFEMDKEIQLSFN